jgi:hypothetical protein
MAATHFFVRRFKRLPAASNVHDLKKIIAIIVVQSAAAAEKKRPIVFRFSFVIYLLVLLFFVIIIIIYIRHMGKNQPETFFSPIDFYCIHIQLRISIRDIY